MAEAPRRAGEGLRALVVARGEAERDEATHVLRALGFATEACEGGEPAADAAEAFDPDLILLDLDGADALCTCAGLRAVDPETGPPILAVIDGPGRDWVARAVEAGASEFVEKPLRGPTLEHRIRFVLGAGRAVSDLRRALDDLRRSEERLAAAHRVARTGNWEWSPEEQEMLWSEEVYRLFEVEPRAGASTFEAFLSAVHPEDRARVEKALTDVSRGAQPLGLDHRIMTPDGEVKVVHQQAELLLRAHDALPCVCGTVQDVTEQRRAEQQVQYLAYYDSLTALPNRRMLGEHLSRLLRSEQSQDRMFAVLFVGLDRFKRVNDTLGHEVGDQLLKAVASRLQSTIRSSDRLGSARSTRGATVSRLGGDEFTVVLTDIRSAEDAAAAGRRILDALKEPFALDGHQLVMGASIGVAVSPYDGDDPDTLVRNADTAMHHAKYSGRGVTQFFSESMNQAALRSLRLENGLRAAIEQDELVLHYQPLFDPLGEAVHGVEALVRWQSPEFGLVSPGEFVPLAEETGLIDALGEWVLRTACRQGRLWQDEGLGPVRIAVNLSSHQLRKSAVVDLVQQVLGESGIPPNWLELEITESALITEEPWVIENLGRLKRLGLRLALDDFGTGYSSLSHLVRFPIDNLKIDRSFVGAIGEDDQAEALVDAVVAMAHRLHLDVTAEGVENEAQREFLSDLGCSLLQGYGLARPAEAEAVTTILARTRR